MVKSIERYLVNRGDYAYRFSIQKGLKGGIVEIGSRGGEPLAKDDQIIFKFIGGESIVKKFLGLPTREAENNNTIAVNTVNITESELARLATELVQQIHVRNFEKLEVRRFTLDGQRRLELKDMAECVGIAIGLDQTMDFEAMASAATARQANSAASANNTAVTGKGSSKPLTDAELKNLEQELAATKSKLRAEITNQSTQAAARKQEIANDLLQYRADAEKQKAAMAAELAKTRRQADSTINSISAEEMSKVQTIQKRAMGFQDSIRQSMVRAKEESQKMIAKEQDWAAKEVLTIRGRVQSELEQSRVQVDSFRMVFSREVKAAREHTQQEIKENQAQTQNIIKTTRARADSVRIKINADLAQSRADIQGMIQSEQAAAGEKVQSIRNQVLTEQERAQERIASIQKEEAAAIDLVRVNSQQAIDRFEMIQLQKQDSLQALMAVQQDVTNTQLSILNEHLGAFREQQNDTIRETRARNLKMIQEAMTLAQSKRDSIYRAIETERMAVQNKLTQFQREQMDSIVAIRKRLNVKTRSEAEAAGGSAIDELIALKRENYAAISAALDADVELAEAEAQQKIESAKVFAESELNVMKGQYKDMLGMVEKETELKKQALETGLESFRASVKAEREQLRSQQLMETQLLTDSLSLVRQQLELDIQNLKDQHPQRLEALQQEHNAQVAAIEKSHEEELAALRAELEAKKIALQKEMDSVDEVEVTPKGKKKKKSEDKSKE